MKHRLAYQLLDAPPHIPSRLLAVRFQAKLHPPNEAGCQIWRGAVRKRADNAPEVGTMRLKTPTGSMMVPSPRVAWFLAGHPWADDSVCFRRLCGQALCCAVDHLQPVRKVDRRKMSVAQVLECRELYWSQEHRPRQVQAPSPIQIASRRLGITPDTVRRVAQGLSVNPGAWRNWQLTAQDVRQAVADAETLVEQLRHNKGSVWTQQRLADRYNTDLSTVANVLAGLLYKDAPGPTSAQEVKEARAAAAREEARRARQASQGDPAIAQRAQRASA